MPNVEVRTEDRLQQRRVLKGQWWLPSNPSVQVGGTLEFAAGEGGRLELQGGLTSADLQQFEQVLFGMADGMRVTICNGLLTAQKRRGFPPDEHIDQESWQCSTVFIGIHAVQGRATQFDVFELETTRLAGWVNEAQPRAIPSPDKFTIEGAIPCPRHLELGDAGILTLWWSQRLNSSRTGVSLVIRPVIEFHPKQQATIDEAWRSFVTPMLFFVTFASGSGDRIASVRAGWNAEKGHSPEIAEILVPSWAEELPGSDRNDSWEHLVQFAELQDRLEAILADWFHLVSESPHSILDFFLVTMTPSMYAEDTFLRVARSIESWHRAAIGGSYMSAEDFERLREKVKGVTDGPEWVFVEPRLRNERTLKQRLDELLTMCGEPVASLLARYRDFTRRVVQTRNSLAHEGEIGDAFTYQELFWAQKTLEHVFRSVLLRRLGFTSEEVERSVARTSEWRWLRDPQNRLAYWQEYVNEDEP